MIEVRSMSTALRNQFDAYFAGLLSRTMKPVVSNIERQLRPATVPRLTDHGAMA
jgi:hypothetical protein